MKSSLSRFYTQSNQKQADQNYHQRHRIKLRTILKSRQDHKAPFVPSTYRSSSRQQKVYTQNSDQIIQNHKISQFHDTKLRSSKSLNIQPAETLPQLRQHSSSINKNVAKRLESLQPEQHQDEAFAQLISKLDQMDAEAEELIRKKIRKMTKREHIITLKNRGKDEITQQIETLISKVKLLQGSIEQKGKSINQAEMKIFTDKKIRLLEKLMAEASTESQVLKKYFFAISAMNQQKKNQNLLQKSMQFNTPRHKRASLSININRSLTREIQRVCNQSSNQLEYQQPKPNQYQTYRYKGKDYIANNQPFPRSSYKRQFLINPKIANFNCKNSDNHGIFGKSRFNSSTYSKDFQRVKTEIVDFKELDSYKNKIKNIEVSYNFRDRKQEVDNYTHKSRKYLQEQLKMRYIDRISSVPSACTQQQALASANSPLLLTTQNQTKFVGQKQAEQSIIKHRQLDNLKNNYRSLINN